MQHRSISHHLLLFTSCRDSHHFAPQSSSSSAIHPKTRAQSSISLWYTWFRNETSHPHLGHLALSTSSHYVVKPPSACHFRRPIQPSHDIHLVLRQKGAPRRKITDLKANGASKEKEKWKKENRRERKKNKKSWRIASRRGSSPRRSVVSESPCRHGRDVCSAFQSAPALTFPEPCRSRRKKRCRLTLVAFRDPRI